MQPKQVKWSTQESPGQTEHLIPPTPEDPRVPSITLLEGGGGVVCLLLGGKWTGTNGSVVAWQRYLPVTITVSNTYCTYLATKVGDPGQTTPTPHTFSASAKQLDLTHPCSRHHMKWGLRGGVGSHVPIMTSVSPSKKTIFLSKFKLLFGMESFLPTKTQPKGPLS